MAFDPFSSKADGLPVTVTELAAPFRQVVLAGRDRPEQPVVIASEQRAIQTFYPGSDKASVQFMGTKNDPVVLRGWFQDPLSELDGGPAERVALFDGIKEGGQLCWLQWGDTIFRTGRVKRTEWEYHRRSRIRYVVTFEVDEANEFVALAPRAVNATIAALQAALTAAVSAAQKAATAAGAAKTVISLVAG